MRTLCGTILAAAALQMAVGAAETNACIKFVTEKGVKYLGEGRNERLDVYRPALSRDRELFPGVVVIHGGGGAGCSRRLGRSLAFRLGRDSVGYPYRVFRKVNHYVLKRMARFLNVLAKNSISSLIIIVR